MQGLQATCTVQGCEAIEAESPAAVQKEEHSTGVS